jgi:hypothetical protein
MNEAEKDGQRLKDTQANAPTYINSDQLSFKRREENSHAHTHTLALKCGPTKSDIQANEPT